MGSETTSFTDQHEHSYRARDIDFHGHFPYVLPGSACDFVLPSSVSKGEKVGGLIYQVNFIANDGKPVTFRVSLATTNP